MEIAFALAIIKKEKNIYKIVQLDTYIKMHRFVQKDKQ